MQSPLPPAPLPRSGSLGGAFNLPLVACYPLLLAAALLSLGTELAGHALLGQEEGGRRGGGGGKRVVCVFVCVWWGG